jgi:predicted flap endonuclease-1-like 5' DNA nuclease
MSWIAIIFIVVILVILWFLFGNKQKDASAPASTVTSRSPAPTPGLADDLKIIEGVGPKIAGILNEAGISTFAQMAQKTGEELRKILDEGGIGTIADPTTWPEQAALAAEGKMEALKELQDRLQGGRKA